MENLLKYWESFKKNSLMLRVKILKYVKCHLYRESKKNVTISFIFHKKISRKSTKTNCENMKFPV